MPKLIPPSLLLFATVSAALLAGNALAQDSPTTRPVAVNDAQLKADVEWLADDARTGRGIGTPGLDASGDYLAQRFKSLGLQPLPGLDGYFQTFNIPFGSDLVADQTSLAADGGVPLRAGVDFQPLGWSAAKDFKGELVFGGYAVSSERYGYDDFAKLDAKGKVVLALRYEPHDAEGNSRFTNGERFSRAAALNAKAKAAEEAGAVALLIVDPPAHHGPADVLMELGDSDRPVSRIPVFHLKRGAADDLLKADGLPDLAELQAGIDKDGKTNSRAGNGLVVSGGFAVTQRTVTLRNVVAMLPGEKADEYVVVGGHYDHLGYGAYGANDGPGQIHNGADDNASGTSVVLGLAEAFAKGPTPPRSLIFCCFTGEEIGLVGSKYLAEHLPVPAADVAAMVNLDMVGRVRDEKLSVGGLGTAAVLPRIVERADADSPLVTSDLGHAFDSRSDQASFIDAGIPSLFLFSGMHEQYHAATDDVDLVNFEGLSQVARFAAEVVQMLSVTPRAELTIQKAAPRGQRRVLGVAVGQQVSGVSVQGVSPDSLAQRAGVRAGDIVMQIGGTPVSELGDIAAALAKLEPGKDTTVVVFRDGEQVTLKAKFEGK